MRAGAARIVALAVLVSGVALATAGDADPITRGVGPTLVRDDADQTKVGARFHLDWRGHTHDLSTGLPWSHDHRVAAQYLWVPKDVAVPSQTEITVAFGASVSLSKPNPPAPMDTPMDSLPSPYKFNYGFAGGRIHAQYEANANRSEHAVVGGAEIFYGFPEKPWVPSLLFTVDAVMPIQSEIRDAAGLDDDMFERFTARAYWIYTRARFTGELDASLFRSTGLDALLEALGWRSGGAVQARLSMRVGQKVLGPIAVDAVYVQYADGQMPTAPAPTNAWTLGIDFGAK